jgi:hypothetical protein
MGACRCFIKVLAGISMLYFLNCAHAINAPPSSVDGVDYDGIGAIIYSRHIRNAGISETIIGAMIDTAYAKTSSSIHAPRHIGAGAT